MNRLLLVLLVLLPAVDSSPVRLLRCEKGNLCSAVVIGPHRAYTAAHCLKYGAIEVDGQPAVGQDLGADLAIVHPYPGSAFSGPYALPGHLSGSGVLVEGFGCRPTPLGMHRESRTGLLLPLTGPAGMRVVFVGEVCPGDSGGALWRDGGGLVGILTARDVEGKGIGYATPIP